MYVANHFGRKSEWIRLSNKYRVRLVLAYMKVKSAFGMVEHLGAFVSL